jgi:hypothetical protein
MTMNDLILDWTTQYFTEPEHTDFEGHPSRFEVESLSETTIGDKHYQLSCRLPTRRNRQGRLMVTEELLTFTGEFDGYSQIYVRKFPLEREMTLEELTTFGLMRAERKIVSPMQQLARRLGNP